MARKFLQYIASVAILAALAVFSAEGRRVRQVPDTLVTPVPDTTAVDSTTLLAARIDSTAILSALDSAARKAFMDSTARAKASKDSLDLLQKSSLERPAFTTAKDSIITDFSNGRRMVYYYGGATVSYQTMKLTADYIEFDMLTNTVLARGRKDPATGEMVGLPEMTDNGQTYKMDEVRYNFTSRKARITNMVTKEAEGILQGKKIKMLSDKSISMRDGVYTVCDLEHPH